jgi:serine/threonine-protein phosphatase 6 regulatory ankyrin repeat subunit B
VGCASLLLEAKVEVDAINARGVTALLIAAEQGFHDYVMLLLQHKADPNGSAGIGMMGFSPIYLAAQKQHVQVVQALIGAGAHVDRPNGQSGATALMMAGERGLTEVFKVLLEAGALPNAQKHDGATSLMLAGENGHVQCLKMLLKKGANPNLGKFDKQNPLMAAVRAAKGDCVSLLLEAGADPNATSLNGATPLMLMIEFTHLISTGAHPVQQQAKKTAEQMVATDPEALKTLSQKYKIHGERSCKEMLELLVHAGADMSMTMTDVNGFNALDLACKIGHAVAVQALLEAGADTYTKRQRPCDSLSGAGLREPRARGGANALVLAAEGGWADVIKLLLETGGIDPGSKKESNGASALCCTAEKVHHTLRTNGTAVYYTPYTTH